MPHVKGNKFKPKQATPPPEPEPEPAAQAAADGKKSKKQKKRAAAAAAAAAGAADVAVEPAVPAAGGAAAPAAAAVHGDGVAARPPSKKQRRKQQQQQQQPQQPQQTVALPAIPTVVAQAPKPGAAHTEAVAAATSNWAALKAHMDATKQPRPAHWRGKRKAEGEGAAGGVVQATVPANRPQSMGSDTAPTKVVAIDCEMVGVGPNGERSALARVCVVNSAGNVLLDRHVRPKERVTDFRTRVSGIRPSNLRDAPPFEQVQRQVADLLAGRIVVGHALENDLEALLLSHRRKDVRDTSRYPPLMRAQARSGRLKARALRHLAAEQLGLQIQEGEHSPVDDARAALYLYMKHRKDWERWVAAGANHHAHPATQAAAAAAAAGGKLGLEVGGLVTSGSGGGQGGRAGRAAKAALLSLEELARKSAHLADL